MTIPPELTKRLQALKTLLELGDIDLAEAAADRLEVHWEEEFIAIIIGHFKAHRYAEADRIISQILAEGTRLIRWADPEIALLEAELEKLASELADAETRLAELNHLIAQFQAAHSRILGERLAKLLLLRMRLREKEATEDPTRSRGFEEARQEYEKYQEERAEQEGAKTRTKWDLSEEEQLELKRLFRRASKKCHPDVVPPEHQIAAASMFRELREAYERGDLARVRHLAELAESGIFLANVVKKVVDQKATLSARILVVRLSLKRARAELAEVQKSETVRVMSDYPDWDVYFQTQAEKLDEEIVRLGAVINNRTS